MSTVGSPYPAHIIVSQAEVRSSRTKRPTQTLRPIKSDQNRVEAAQEVEGLGGQSVHRGYRYLKLVGLRALTLRVRPPRNGG